MQCEALAPSLEPPARVAPVRLAVDYRHGWRGTGSADDMVEGVVRRHHLHRSGSDPLSTFRRSGALSSSGSTADETMRSGCR